MSCLRRSGSSNCRNAEDVKSGGAFTGHEHATVVQVAGLNVSQRSFIAASRSYCPGHSKVRARFISFQFVVSEIMTGIIPSFEHPASNPCIDTNYAILSLSSHPGLHYITLCHAMPCRIVHAIPSDITV
jgi:hypothetical protein